MSQPTPTNAELCGAIVVIGHGHEEPVEPRLLVPLVQLEMARLVRGRYHLTGKGWVAFEKIKAGSDVATNLSGDFKVG